MATVDNDDAAFSHRHCLLIADLKTKDYAFKTRHITSKWKV